MPQNLLEQGILERRRRVLVKRKLDQDLGAALDQGLLLSLSLSLSLSLFSAVDLLPPFVKSVKLLFLYALCI